MAARKTPRREWETRLIVASRLQNRLLAFIMADAITEPEPAPVVEGEPPPKPKKSKLMTGEQVHACLGLLKKYVPDLKSVEITGNPDHPVVHEIRRVIVDPANPADSASVPAATDPESV